MDNMVIKRMDHLGIIAGVIKEIGLIELIDSCIQRDTQEQEVLTPGETVSGMILNGLGFSDKPLSLTPLFFENIPIDLLVKPNITHEHYNRHKLGRVLDDIYDFGCEKLFYLVASAATKRENIDTRFVSLDTTSITLTGEYDADCDEEAIRITHGYSKDHRPDLKQFIQELLVSQDGGVPLMLKCWDGNATDSKIFEERAKRLITEFASSDAPRYLVADSKLYHKNNAENLSQLRFITRIPGSIKKENIVIKESIKSKHWIKLDESNRYQAHDIIDYDIKQRWMVVYSDKARERSYKTLTKAVNKEAEMLTKAMWHLSHLGHACQHDAEKSAITEMKKSRYHEIESVKYTTKNIYETKGRPNKNHPPDRIEHYVSVTFKRNDEKIEKTLEQRSCYVIGSNVDPSELTDKEIIEAYKKQNASIENMGFRFLKDPIFFASSLFLKKNSRIMALVTMMNLALLIYSIAQRRLRKALKETNDTLPNQINKPIKNPTMRWIFQLMSGINVVYKETGKNITNQIYGLNDLRRKIIKLLGKSVMEIYRAR